MISEQTATAVVAVLVRRGVPATYEYPGYVSVFIDANLVLNLNDQGDTLDVDVMVNGQSECGEVIESSLPHDSEDVLTIADHVACAYTGAMETRCKCGRGPGKHHPDCPAWDSHVDNYDQEPAQ